MFKVVSELESRKRKKRLQFVTFSVAAHGLVLGSIVAASLWEVGDITPPEVIRIVYVPQLPRASEGGGGARRRPCRARPLARSHHRRLI